MEDSNAITDSEEDMDSDDGISDTWIPGNNNDLEGEIEMENAADQTDGGNADGDTNHGVGDGRS